MPELEKPAASHRFMVEFSDDSFNSGLGFLSVEGLGLEIAEFVDPDEPDTYVEYDPLVLIRTLPEESALTKYCVKSIEKKKGKAVDLVIHLLNEEHEPVITWKIKKAFPIRWSVSPFDAGASGLVEETMVFEYESFQMKS